MYFLKTGEQTLEQTWEQTCEQTWEQSIDLGNRLGVFFKNFVKDNVVTKIHTFKNKNDFKNSGDIFFWGTDLGDLECFLIMW